MRNKISKMPIEKLGEEIASMAGSAQQRNGAKYAHLQSEVLRRFENDSTGLKKFLNKIGKRTCLSIRQLGFVTY